MVSEELFTGEEEETPSMEPPLRVRAVCALEDLQRPLALSFQIVPPGRGGALVMGASWARSKGSQVRHPGNAAAPTEHLVASRTFSIDRP